MDRAQYEAMIHAESGHWWFRGRRKVISRLLADMKLRPDASLLEIGCGGGGNLPMLSSFSRKLRAVEPNPVLREHAAGRGLCEVREGLLPDPIPYEGEKFDLICMFDVLEHVKEDTEAVQALGKRLTENGRMLVTVPANPSLWSSHDVENGHFRRYTKKSLRSLFKNTGFTVERISFFNFFLFPPIWFCRKLGGAGSARKEGKPDLETPSFGLSGVFFSLMSLEARLLSFFNLPFGVSLVCVVRR
jgi:SAM-dependent methyltransferase